MKLRGLVILALILCVPAACWAALTLSHHLVAESNTPPAMRQFIPTDPPHPAPQIAFADSAIADEENETLNLLAEGLGISEARADELLDSVESDLAERRPPP